MRSQVLPMTKKVQLGWIAILLPVLTSAFTTRLTCHPRGQSIQEIRSRKSITVWGAGEAISKTSTTTISRSSSSSSLSSSPSSSSPSASYDVVVVGSGIGGLCSAAMLSLYGYKVAVFESHYAPGGCAHGYSVYDKNLKGLFQFDTGPSFFSGLNPNIPTKLSNPLRTILDAIDEEVECIPYTTFGLKFPEGDFVHTPNFVKDVLDPLEEQNKMKASTSEDSKTNIASVNNIRKKKKQWNALMKKMEPLASAVSALPTIALRGDVGVAITSAQFLPDFLTKTNPIENLKLTKPFSSILQDAKVTDPFIQNWLDLLCFCLSGLPADGTITAEMAMMMGEFYEPSAVMDCPKGGAKAIIDALVRGIEKNGGSIFVNSNVDKINIENGSVTGVTLKRNGQVVKASKGVISNLSIWDLLKSGIVDSAMDFPEKFVKERLSTPLGKSFMHMHIGFKASEEELEKLQAHYMYIDDWSRGVEAEDNAVLLSIPSVHDGTLAPKGYAVLHIYTPATEDFTKWEKFVKPYSSCHREAKTTTSVKDNKEEYENLKESRSKYLWYVLEKIIPDIRDRTHTVHVGTPITHQRFLRRYKGSYGPAIKAGEGSFPFPNTPVKGLLVCGDSCFPGIGVPAVAGSGLLAANSLSLETVRAQLEVLKKIPTKQQQQ